MNLKKYLLMERKDEIAENVVRRLMTYAIGRELTYRDRFEIKKLLKLAKDDGYKMQNIIVLVCQSPIFTGAKS